MARSAELPDAGTITTRRHPGALTWPQSDARPRLPSDVRALFPKSAVRTYDRGETLTGGGLGDGFTILLEGRAKLTMQDPDGRQVTLGVVGAGEIVAAGETRFHGGIALSAVAHPTCRVLHVTASDMLSAMQADRGVASLVVRALCAGLADARSRIASLAFRGVRARVAGALLECANAAGGEWVVEVGSEEIARRVAASREMVTRVLRPFVETGLIRRRGRTTVILDAGALRAAADERG